MASYPTFRRDMYRDVSAPKVCIDFGVDYAKFDESRYAERYGLAQRSFFGPSGGKSDAADPFLMLPGSILELFVR